MIFRLLILAAAVYLLYRLALGLLRRYQGPPARPEAPYLPMTACAGCGAHVPAGTLSTTGHCGRCAARP